MKNISIVISYTIKEAVRKKSFIISTIVMFLIIIIASNIPNIINMFSGQETTGKIIVVDESGVLADVASYINETKQLNYIFELDNQSSKDELKEKINNGEIYAIMILKYANSEISFDYIIKQNNIFSGAEIETIATIIKNIQVNMELEKIKASPSLIEAINKPVQYNIEEIEGNSGNNNFGIAMAVSFILFFAIYFYGYSVSASVSSEKTSRVMETLITSTNPTTIVIGKTIGMGIVGLLQMISLLVVGAISYRVFVPESFEMVSEIIANVNISIGSIFMLIIYFIIGYTVFAFLNAVTGATVSKAEDIQSANAPISFISLGSFYLAYFTATVPNGPASKFASIFPFSAPFSMPGRILAGAASTGEVALSIAVLLLTAAILAFISIKVYSAAILHYGDRLKFSDLVKMFQSKD
jgi:ABC-2 type transport system permease protein